MEPYKLEIYLSVVLEAVCQTRKSNISNVGIALASLHSFWAIAFGCYGNHSLWIFVNNLSQ